MAAPNRAMLAGSGVEVVAWFKLFTKKRFAGEQVPGGDGSMQ